MQIQSMSDFVNVEQLGFGERWHQKTATGSEPDTPEFKLRRQIPCLKQNRRCEAGTRVSEALWLPAANHRETRWRTCALGGAAAQEFSQAAGAAANASSAPSSPIVDGTATLAQASTAASDDPDSDTAKDASPTNDSNMSASDSVDAKQAKLAYRATADDGGAGSNVSSGNQKIMDQFSAILAEIKALLDKAKRDMQADKQAASQPASTAPSDDMMI